jgi:hypothetical protein
MQAQNVGWQNCTGFLHRRCPGVRNFSSVRRFRGNLAIHCQEEMKSDGLLAIDAPALKRRTTDGAEAPYSGASGTMRQRAVSRQPTFWDCTRRRVPSAGIDDPVFLVAHFPVPAILVAVLPHWACRTARCQSLVLGKMMLPVR